MKKEKILTWKLRKLALMNQKNGKFEKTGSHETGGFFEVIGVKVSNTDREVGKKGWTQPMMQKILEVLGILIKKLMEYHTFFYKTAEPEILVSFNFPRLQATTSNLLNSTLNTSIFRIL